MTPSKPTPSEMASECLKHANFVEPPSWCTCDPEVGHAPCEGCERGSVIHQWLMSTMKEIANGPTHLDAVINREWCNMLCYRLVSPGLFMVHQRMGFNEGEAASVTIAIDFNGNSELRLYDGLLEGWTLIKKSPTIRDVGSLVRMIDPQNEQVHVHTPAPQKSPSLSPVIQDIVNERVKQIERGYGPEHDDRHFDGRLATTAVKLLRGQEDDWGIRDHHVGDTRKVRIIAMALLVAEQERLDRLGVESAVTRDLRAKRENERSRAGKPIRDDEDDDVVRSDDDSPNE
jgi:hypothetical protein